ncbi:hypothetical protein NPIL_183341 [Nephila pilipes]|uniref:Uncharacterized protein n=1 Tax=Nephila pilipes TaxID=299642 RepID=A0A8X6TCN1_NEPPI|nr:hypothetical protein NPIL_183341 [Nephila pilipes]
MPLDVYPQSSIEEEDWMVLKLQRKCTPEEDESRRKGFKLFRITYVGAVVLFSSPSRIWKNFDWFYRSCHRSKFTENSNCAVDVGKRVFSSIW